MWGRGIFRRTRAGKGVNMSYTLTTDHPSSSYGQPVLVDGEGRAYGPGDWIIGPFGVPVNAGLYAREREGLDFDREDVTAFVGIS